MSMIAYMMPQIMTERKKHYAHLDYGNFDLRHSANKWIKALWCGDEVMAGKIFAAMLLGEELLLQHPFKIWET